MPRVLRWSGRAVGGLVGLGIVAYVLVYGLSEAGRVMQESAHT